MALDAAGPLWIGENRLLPTDAIIVESIHTNNILGLYEEHGTVDFYVNGAGVLQPGCRESSDGLYNAGKMSLLHYLPHNKSPVTNLQDTICSETE